MHADSQIENTGVWMSLLCSGYNVGLLLLVILYNVDQTRSLFLNKVNLFVILYHTKLSCHNCDFYNPVGGLHFHNWVINFLSF